MQIFDWSITEGQGDSDFTSLASSGSDRAAEGIAQCRAGGPRSGYRGCGELRKLGTQEIADLFKNRHLAERLSRDASGLASGAMSGVIEYLTSTFPLGNIARWRCTVQLGGSIWRLRLSQIPRAGPFSLALHQEMRMFQNS